MALQGWNPATKVSRGNVSVGIAPTVVDINAPKLSELNTGVGLDCSITTFNGTSSVDSQSVDWLCNPASETLPGSTSHTIDDILIKASGQEDEQLLNALNIGDTVYIWRRDGLPHDTALRESQKVWVWKATITGIDPAEASNTYIGINAHVTVMARTPKPVAIVSE